MAPHADSRQALRQYLLGSLPQDDLPGLEGRLLTDEGLYEELLLEEAELIDDYVGGGLAADERPRFERHFLCTEERRRQLSFALALGRYASAQRSGEPAAEEVEEAEGARGPARPRGPSWVERVRAFGGGGAWGLRGALALGALALVFGALWVWTRPNAPRTFATLTLAAGAGDRAEGARAEKVSLPLRADALRVRMKLPDGAASAARYRVELLGQGGRREALEAEGQDEGAVTVVIPAARLARGQYALRLFALPPGAEERRVGSYLFDVE